MSTLAFILIVSVSVSAVAAPLATPQTVGHQADLGPEERETHLLLVHRVQRKTCLSSFKNTEPKWRRKVSFTRDTNNFKMMILTPKVIQEAVKTILCHLELQPTRETSMKAKWTGRDLKLQLSRRLVSTKEWWRPSLTGPATMSSKL